MFDFRASLFDVPAACARASAAITEKHRMFLKGRIFRILQCDGVPRELNFGNGSFNAGEKKTFFDYNLTPQTAARGGGTTEVLPNSGITILY